MGQGSAIGWPLGRFPKVPDFGIFSPLNFAPSADSGQKGPQTGPKIGFGANKKIRLRQSMPQTHWAHFGAFLFCIMMGRKMTSRKGSAFPPETPSRRD